MIIHWFSITVFQDVNHAEKIWRDYFLNPLGELTALPSGGRGYRQIALGLLGSKLYTIPVQQGKDGSTHYHIELPGTACEAVVPDLFSTLLGELKANGVRFNVKRLDLAFDNAPFTPSQFRQAIQDEKLVSLAKRETLVINESPYELREDGEQGTMTVYIGSRESQRMVRVYNKRGFTRLEFQMRDERANAVALAVFSTVYQDWHYVAMSHLRQYIDFKGLDWWAVFICLADRADLKISSARVVSLAAMESWFDRQVVLALAVYLKVWGKAEGLERINKMSNYAFATRDISRYRSLLQLAW